MLRTYYHVKCFYIAKEPDRFHCFDIGIFDSKEKANKRLKGLKINPAFASTKKKPK